MFGVNGSRGSYVDCSKAQISLLLVCGIATQEVEEKLPPRALPLSLLPCTTTSPCLSGNLGFTAARPREENPMRKQAVGEVAHRGHSATRPRLLQLALPYQGQVHRRGHHLGRLSHTLAFTAASRVRGRVGGMAVVAHRPRASMAMWQQDDMVSTNFSWASTTAQGLLMKPCFLS